MGLVLAWLLKPTITPGRRPHGLLAIFTARTGSFFAYQTDCNRIIRLLQQPERSAKEWAAQGRAAQLGAWPACRQHAQHPRGTRSTDRHERRQIWG
jgi:hypothetical protein